MSADLVPFPSSRRYRPISDVLPDFSAPREQIAKIDEARRLAIIQIEGEFDVERCRRAAGYFELLARKIEELPPDDGGPHAA